MIFWILAGLGVYLLSVYLPAILYLPREGLVNHAGPRDELPEAGAYTNRARRALGNLQENLPIFLTLAILALVAPSADMAQAILGAQVFVIARLVYIPVYLISVPWTRSLAYLAGLVGNVIQLLALI